ncbi:unnamed protein product, partial [Phaeothamnion confervicola]
RKATPERDSVDGGMSFSIGRSATGRPSLTVRRIEEGQEIRKVFAERIVVRAVVKAVDALPGAEIASVLH